MTVPNSEHMMQQVFAILATWSGDGADTRGSDAQVAAPAKYMMEILNARKKYRYAKHDYSVQMDYAAQRLAMRLERAELDQAFNRRSDQYGAELRQIFADHHERQIFADAMAEAGRRFREDSEALYRRYTVVFNQVWA
ncbi:MAG: hypothetical protein SGARI_006025, partial [Bacillariaceae sp.]